MEFFRDFTGRFDADGLQQHLTIDTLPRHCAAVDKVLESAGDEGEIYCLWGQFRVHRERIRGGVRFTLPGCPNALAWTVTTQLPPDPAMTVIHCTINRRVHDPDFVDSIEGFLDAMQEGLAQAHS
jgi:hypothetical protein